MLAALIWPAQSTAAVDALLQGQFAMKGTITRADNVQGEHKGQSVKRKWRFDSKCGPAPYCESVVLHRARAKHRVDKLTLKRTGVGSYSGKGKFHFSLRCAGRVYKHGGEARVKISLKITASTTVQGVPFATNVTATYSNPRRINHTQCGGDLGRDGASYTGKIKSQPTPPSAAFDVSGPPARKVSFTDRSKRGSENSPIATRSWDFGDGSAGSGRNPSHTYTTAGTYMVTETVTDENGLVDTATKQIVVT